MYRDHHGEASSPSSSSSNSETGSPRGSESDAAPVHKSALGRKKDADYIPPHLRDYVFHSQDDFYVSRYFDPVLLAHLMYEGFLPIASEFQERCFLLPKLHRKRCVLLLDAPQHIPKSVKKRGKKYKLVLNRSFEQVVDGCHAQHGIPWLYPPIVEAFKVMYSAGTDGLELYKDRKVRFWTVEILDVETNRLCAGELGYTIGKVYTSLTGFSSVNGAGTVQLYALGKLLYLCGMEVWDLGMSMPYKMSLGAEDLDRDTFLEHLHRWRKVPCLLELPNGESSDRSNAAGFNGVHVKALFDMTKPKEHADEHSGSNKSMGSKVTNT